MAFEIWVPARVVRRVLELPVQIRARQLQRLEASPDVLGIPDRPRAPAFPNPLQVVHPLLNTGIRVDQAFSTITHDCLYFVGMPAASPIVVYERRPQQALQPKPPGRRP